jgi:Cohesin domain/Bacterial TSP3 repeat
MMRMKNTILILLFSLGSLGLSAQATTYEMVLGEGYGEASDLVQIPITLNTASDVASMEFQINYDASLLTVTAVTNPAGSLGDAFDLDYEVDDGLLIIRLFRMGGLVSGEGLLCQVQCEVNAGAEPAMWCDLALAYADLGTAYGASLAWENEVSPQGSQFWTTYSSTNDADGDGLSDYAEQMLNGSADYDPGGEDTGVDDPDTDGDGMLDGWEVQFGLAPLVDDADSDLDGDGLSNGQEAQLGLNPSVKDTDGDGMDDWAEQVAGTSGTNANDVLVLSTEPEPAGPGQPVFSWLSVTDRIYSVRYCTNLMGPWPTAAVHIVQGDGLEKAFTNENPADAKGYYRLTVDQE